MSRTTRTTESTVNFGVSARLVAILGQHLIRDNTVGLMELIKNGYDADADHVVVEMYDLAQPELTTIIVEDNGVGMTREILTGPWLTVAHGHKEESKALKETSRRGRIPLGEKGVGRFAAHKLGHKLVLITRPKGLETELVLEINWDEFETSKDSIGTVGLKLTERAPRHFAGSNAHGTRMEMTTSRDRWQAKDMDRLHTSLVRLTNPRFGVQDFKVTLRCPEYPLLEDLENFDITEKFQFRLGCQVGADGVASYDYQWRDEKLQVHSVTGEIRLFTEGLQRHLACGPVEISLCAWLMKQPALQALGTSTDQIKRLSGVSIYRDGFRVLPYGDEGDDWLGLDARRINNPSVRFGNRQIIGSVSIDQVHNRGLIDKTNREGLQENEAYFDLKQIVTSALNLMEQHSLTERQQHHEKEKEARQQLTEKVERLDKVVKTITTAQVRELPITYPGPSVDEVQKKAAVVPETTATQVVLELDQVQEIKQIVHEVAQTAKTMADMQDEEKEAYLQLIGSGLAAERFIHEMDRQIARAMEACATLRAANLTGEVGRAARQLDVFVNSLRNEMRILGQLRYVRRSQRAKEISVREIIEFLLLSYHADIDAKSIKVDAWLQEDFTVFMAEAAVAQVLDNILNNAIYWLGQADPAGGRRLRVDLDASERTIMISNNGPAVDRVVRDRLFTKPFATTKDDGHGLGMYLSHQIMQRAGGSISLVPEDECMLAGPGFLVQFPALHRSE